jgi:two-component system, sensor histidine kinase and response regulator
MNAILGMADLLAESDLDRQQRDYVRIFQNGGAKLLGLINNILDLSKVESGRFDLEVVDFDLSAVLEKAIEIMSVRAQAKGLSLASEVLPDVPARLSGDPDRLRQLLINLIGNALKFTERGGVSLRVERGPLGADVRLRFSVTDTGIGVAPDMLDLIFESFAQGD